MERIVTDDGSQSLYDPFVGEPFRSRRGARSESWHVFVAGSGVAARLAAGRPTAVLEIGLGTARNLGTTAAVALSFGTPLRYVACERTLLPADAWAALEPEALGPPAFRDALLSARRAHDVRQDQRLRFALGPVRVEVMVGDARDTPWPANVDAVYLDAFSPAVNPELWTERFLARIAASLTECGTVVSYCVRGQVRRALAAAGLRVERRPGPPGGKRERLWAQRVSPRAAAGPLAGGMGAARLAGLDVAVVGSGVAGASLALAAACAGASVTVFEGGDGRGGASGVPAALINAYRGRSGRATTDDRLGAARTWSWAAALEAEGLPTGAHPSGVVRVADHPRQARAWRDRPGAVPFAPVSQPGPGRWRAPHGGMLVPSGGWIDPARWLPALRHAAEARHATWHLDARVGALERCVDGRWRAGLSQRGLAAGRFAVVALCLGASPAGALPHHPVTTLPGSVALARGHLPPRPLAGAVYAAPAASPQLFGLDPRAAWMAIGGGDPRRSDDAEALRRALARALSGEVGAITATWQGRRALGPDPRPQVARLDEGVWWFGSFAGRGFLRAALEAERLVVRWQRGER